jgi:hypothetical protein
MYKIEITAFGVTTESWSIGCVNSFAEAKEIADRAYSPERSDPWGYTCGRDAFVEKLGDDGNLSVVYTAGA